MVVVLENGKGKPPMKDLRPLWMRDEGPGELDSLERLVKDQEWAKIAGELSEDESIPRAVMDREAVLAVAMHLVRRGLHLQPDGDDYWTVERVQPFRKPLQIRRPGERKAVG
jgi:hypothetical protein